MGILLRHEIQTIINLIFYRFKDVRSPDWPPNFGIIPQFIQTHTSIYNALSHTESQTFSLLNFKIQSQCVGIWGRKRSGTAAARENKQRMMKRNGLSRFLRRRRRGCFCVIFKLNANPRLTLQRRRAALSLNSPMPDDANYRAASIYTALNWQMRDIGK